MQVLPSKSLVLVALCLFAVLPGPGFSSGSGSGSGSGSNSGLSEREEFLRKFAQDPSAIKTAPAPTATPAEDHPNTTDNKKLETLIQNFRKSATPVKESNPKAAADEEDGQAQGTQGTMDMSALKNLQGMMGSGDGKISPEELLKKMQAGGMAIPGMPGTSPGGSGDYSLVLYQMLAPFRSQSEEQVTQIFQQKLEVGPMGILLKTIPGANKIPNLIARIARDETALPSVVKIMNQRAKLTQYGVFILVTFIISFAVKRLRQKQDDSIFSGMKSGILRAIFMSGLRFTVFFVLFSTEFTPLWHVIKRSF